MASSTPSALITSSRGAADTTAGRFYFYTPSAQVLIPLTGPHLPPTCAHSILLWGKIIRERQRTGGGGKNIRRPKSYAAAQKLSRAGAGSQKFEKKPQIVAQCRSYPIPYLYTLSRTISYLYTLNRTIPYPNTLSRTIHYLNTLSRTIPYLNTLSRTIPYLNTLGKNPKLTQNQILIGSQSESSTKNPKTSSANQNRVSLCRNIPYLNTLPEHTLSQYMDGGPFSLLGTSRLLYRILIHGGSPTPTWSAHTLITNVLDPELTQDYFSQVSEDIEERVTKKLSKEFSKTESRILGALSKLDELLLNPQVRTCSLAVPGTSTNNNSENRETTGDRSSNDPYPEVGYFSHHSGQSNSPKTEKHPHMVTRVTEEVRRNPHMVRGATEESRQCPHLMTATQEEVHYCSPTTSSGKQTKACSTSQPQFRSENTPATIEAHQILLALQQLATNSNSVNFNNNISRISKMPKSLTTTIPTFDGKSEKFELFEDLFQTSLKMHNQLTEENKINYFHSLMRGDALQTFKNITSPNREILWEILSVFRRKYVKRQSMATVKHNFQRLVFNPANQKLVDFLDELQKLAKDAFGVAAQAIIKQFIYAKIPEEIN